MPVLVAGLFFRSYLVHRVLVLTEFSGLNTGYATYGRNLISHLTSKYDVAELASYLHPGDKRRQQFPWKIYSTLPTNEEEKRVYDSDSHNQFGKWQFEQVCLDFKPTIVVAFRDYWMDSFILESPFRKFFNFVWMPTVDSMPQEEQWLYSFSEADGVFTYQDWSYNQLKKYGSNINLLGAAPPCATKYSPQNKTEIKKQFGLEQYKIVGTVMRNQRRKLFPDLFKSFREFLDRSNRKDVLLYCHTAIPDMGWDIPSLLKEHGLSSKVLFTYKCNQCNAIYPTFFAGELAVCEHCGKRSSQTCTVQNGADERVMNLIYNMFDLYVQYSVCEGLGIPQLEAAACGVPVCGVDYSAMEDVIRKLNGFPLKPLHMQKELETGCMRAVPDNELFINFLLKYFNEENKWPEYQRQTLEGYSQHYSDWAKTAKKWADYIDGVDFSYYNNMWSSPPSLHNPAEVPDNLSDSDFVRFLIANVLGEPEKLGSYLETRMIRDLNHGRTNNPSPSYFNEMSSLFARPQDREFSRETAYNIMIDRLNKKNYWEQKRAGQ